MSVLRGVRARISFMLPSHSSSFVSAASVVDARSPNSCSICSRVAVLAKADFNINTAKGNGKSGSNRTAVQKNAVRQTRNRSRKFPITEQKYPPGKLPFALELDYVLNHPLADGVIASLVIFNCLAFALQTIDVGPVLHDAFVTYEHNLSIMSLLEYIGRWYGKGLSPRYLLSRGMLTDFAAVAPVAFASDQSEAIFVRILRLSRILRIRRVIMGTDRSDEVLGSLTSLQARLLGIGLTIFSLLYVTAGLFYQLEKDMNPYINNFFDAFYYSTITLFTVGFGDVTPFTEGGRTITVLSVITGAILVPFQVSEFERVRKYAERDDVTKSNSDEQQLKSALNSSSSYIAVQDINVEVIMDEEYLIFADADAMYPGNIIRKAQPVNWSSLLQTSIQRQRQYNKKKKQSVQPSPSNSPSHTSASASAPTSSSSRLSGPDQISSSMSALADVTASVSTTSGIDVVRESSSMSPPVTASTRGVSLADKICTLLSESTLQLDAVKKFSWAGLPSQYRAPIWKLLLGYAPKTAERRPDTIERKRREYREAVDQHYAAPVALPSGEGALNDSQLKYSSSDSNATSTIHDDVTMRQIAVDIPRTSPGQRLFQIPDVQLALQRVLYVWAVRHPASGYVQGMNDLVTPFMYVFLADYADNATRAVLMHASDLSTLSDAPTALANAEADAYWCLTALLNDIQDYYTFSQPGIQRRVHFLRELVSRVDANLCSHLEEQGLDFLQFSFRWMNCLLMRELPFPVIVRVWDTYLAEADGFAVFHVYVCAALLVSFSEELLEMEFQDLVMFLQNLPTQNWTEKNIDIILSQAYLWRTIFGASPSHLQ